MFKKIFNYWIKWRDSPYLKVYRGFGHSQKLFIHGHLLKGLSIARERPSKYFWKNAKEMLKRFIVSPWPDQKIKLTLQGEEYWIKTRETGYFSIVIEGNFPKKDVSYRLEFWHEEQHVVSDERIDLYKEPEKLIISDIDDTILISHATNTLKKLYLLLSRNPQQRRPFKGIVNSYCKESKHPFFYVSSSEWNLYDFVMTFCEYHKFPRGVYLLQDIKKWTELFSSGGGDHDHKYEKIEFLLLFFGRSHVQLVGDSGQKDPVLYSRVAHNFPGRVISIHIRDVRKSRRIETGRLLQGLHENEVKTELFKDHPDFSIAAKSKS